MHLSKSVDVKSVLATKKITKLQTVTDIVVSSCVAIYSIRKRVRIVAGRLQDNSKSGIRQSIAAVGNIRLRHGTVSSMTFN